MIKHFVTTYGSEYHSLVDTILENPALAERVDPDMEVTVAEIDHAVRQEMAQKLIDIVQRRTELGSTGMPSLTVLRKCAKLMAKELGWDASRQEQEVNSVIQAYPVKILERISN
jgi:glycerol-3-phosphate dehydrogenase